CGARRPRPGPGRSRDPSHRKPDGEPRATADAIADVDRAAVRLDDLARDGQAEARAARTRREEGLEDASADLTRDARAVVRDGQLDPIAGAVRLDPHPAARRRSR